MGMTLNATNGLLVTSMVWMNAKAPEFGKFIAKTEWKKLDDLFFRVAVQSVIVVTAGAVVGCGAIWYLQFSRYQFGERFISVSNVAILLVAVIFQIIINCFATYLRAHKKEPFMIPSLCGAVSQGCATWFLGMHYSAFGVTLGFLLNNLLIGLPVSYIIWQKCRRAWHYPINCPIK